MPAAAIAAIVLLGLVALTAAALAVYVAAVWWQDRASMRREDVAVASAFLAGCAVVLTAHGLAAFTIIRFGIRLGIRLWAAW